MCAVVLCVVQCVCCSVLCSVCVCCTVCVLLVNFRVWMGYEPNRLVRSFFFGFAGQKEIHFVLVIFKFWSVLCSVVL